MSLITRIALAALLLAPALGAQRRPRGVQPDTASRVPPPPKQPDTTLVRKTPDGFVLDFQNQPLSVVLSAIAEAGGLNVTFANLPTTPVTLRMGQTVTKEQALDVLRGVAEVNGLKITEGPSLIRIEGARPVTAQQTQQQAQQAAQMRLFTYRLKHANAVALAPVLMNLLSGAGTVGGNAGANNNNTGGFQFNIPPVPAAGRGGVAGVGGGVGGGGAAAPAAVAPGRGGGNAFAQAFQQAFGGNALSNTAAQIRIVAEESTNSLLVRSTNEDWALVQQVLQSVDLRPLQVLIEVTIAQVQRTHDLNVGVSGTVTNQSRVGVGLDTTGSLPSAASALDFVALLTGGHGTVNYSVALNALQSRGDVRILSLPVIIGQNNKEAVLNVGSSVPFIQVSQTSGIDPTGRVQTVQYQDVGTVLTITPTINPDGYVNLAVKQTNNSATNDVQFDAPIINKREATTQIFIRDGQTTVIGGLSDDTRSKNTSGIPFLSRIPLIGFLFGNAQRDIATNELFLFLTPHIVSSDEDIDRLREAVKGSSELLIDVPVTGRIHVSGDTMTVGKVPAKPAADSVRARPDSTRRPK